MKEAISNRFGMILPVLFAGGEPPPLRHHFCRDRRPRRSVLSQRLGDIGKHIFHKDAVARGGVADEHVRHGAHDAPVLQNGAAAQECG